MKTLNAIIQEKLKINSKSKVSTLTKDIAKYLGISETDAETLESEYLYKEYFELNNKYKKDLPATQFEIVFLIASMLVDDNAEVSQIMRLGTIGYKKNIGPSNPYDYSWFDKQFGRYGDLLDIVKDQYTLNKFNKLFNEVYEFCKHAGINEPDKIFSFYENIDIN